MVIIHTSLSAFLSTLMFVGRLSDVELGVISLLHALLGPVRGNEALALFEGASHGFLAPAYVLLTHASYTSSSEQIIRSVLWAGSLLIFKGLYFQMYATSWSEYHQKYLSVGWASLSILLAAYASFILRPPDQIRWGIRAISMEAQAKLKRSRTWTLSSVSGQCYRLGIDAYHDSRFSQDRRDWRPILSPVSPSSWLCLLIHYLLIRAATWTSNSSSTPFSHFSLL